MFQGYRIDITAFEKYKEKIVNLVDQRLHQIHTPHTTDKRNNYEKAINNLKKHYIITTADKASSNYVIVCKYFYIRTLLKELGITCRQGSILAIGNTTYKPTTKDLLSIHKKHSKHLKSIHPSITYVTPAENIAILYGLPKLHKIPYKFRYIAGASNTTATALATILLHTLKHFQQHFIRYTNVIQQRTGKRTYWAIKNNTKVLQCVNSIKDNSLVYTGDFSTMYTNLPHNIIFRNIFKLFDMLYANAGKQFVTFKDRGTYGYSKPYYSNERTINSFNFDITSIKELTEVVIHDSFIRCGKQILRQTSGIPMGGNASPLLADLTLSYMEYEYLNSIGSNLAMRNHNIFRYVDDIIAFNCPNFMELAQDIYPDDIPLERTNNDDYSAHYLDININTHDRRMRLYDKRRDFNFAVNQVTNPSSCVHKKQLYGIFTGQFIRTLRITNRLEDVIDETSQLVNDYIDAGYSKDILILHLCKVCTRHQELLCKFGLFDKKHVYKSLIRKVC